MRILVVATKIPWPPVDGGRLVLWLSIQGLLAEGHTVRVIAPFDGGSASGAAPAPLPTEDRLQIVPVAVRPGSRWRVAAQSMLHNKAITVIRHRFDAVRRAVADAMREFEPDVIHVEQLQAFSNCSEVLNGSTPVVLRMQNVESELWRRSAAGGPARLVLAAEARRVAAAERSAIQAAARTVALTEVDAHQLRTALPAAEAFRVASVAPAFPGHLAAGTRLPGEPAIALAGSGGWRPNAEAARWFVDWVWPTVARDIAGARLHVIGGERLPVAGGQWHPAPADSADAFPAEAIAVVPLAVASGIRMRILEAWARGLPVVATAIAARGLDVTDGVQLLMAEDAAAFSRAIGRLATDTALRRTLVEQGKAYLEARHSPVQATQALVATYQAAIDERAAR